MNSEAISRKAGKEFILKMFFSLTVCLTLGSCTKDELRINPFNKAGKNNDQTGIETPPPAADTLACGGFRTQTQGGWGSKPNGNNPGKYLHTNFAGAFPNGLSVGCTYKITLTSAQAVTDYLPAGGSPAVLTSNYTNPVGLKNNLASQLVALTLSVRFDLHDPKFSSSSVALGNLLIGSGPFKGKRITDVLAEANNVLGGCTSNYTVAQLNEVLTAINENFVDGTKNGGFLVCPGNIVITFQ